MVMKTLLLPSMMLRWIIMAPVWQRVPQTEQ